MSAPRFSIPTRVFVSFVLLLCVFTVVIAVSVSQHRRTASTLRLLHTGYIPLALSVGEIRATQALFNTLLDRLLEEEDSTATRGWLAAARRVRPMTVQRALDQVSQIERMRPPSVDNARLLELRSLLTSVLRRYESDQAEFSQLFRHIATQNETGASHLLLQTRQRERSAERRLRRAWDAIQQQIAETSASAERQERNSVVVLVLLTLISLVLGVTVTLYSKRLLAPLPVLQRRVEAVKRGDLAARLAPKTQDELGRLAAEFERMVEALAARDERLIRSERLAAVGRMAAHVTHEVRNPLSSIALNAELLADELGQANAEARGLLRAIQAEVDRLTGLTEEYLRLARLPVPRLEPEDLGVLVQSVLDFVAREMQNHKVEIEVTCEPSLPIVMVDEPQIRQALLNLLRNAREAMPDGGKIYVEVVGEREGVVLRIADEGTGIAAPDRDRIFDLYYTTKEHGTGLGLPLTQQIVVAHGGTIRCEQGEKGALFEIWLPTANAVRPDAAVEIQTPEARSGLPASATTNFKGTLS